MNGEVTIEVREGETMADALLRTAKERKASLPPGDYTVKGITEEEAQAQIKKATQSRKRAPKKDQTRPVGEFGGDPSTGEPVEDTIFMAVHIYQRKGETPEKARMNAKHEREMHGPGTVVFAHLHHFGQTCNSNCKARIVL